MSKVLDEIATERQRQVAVEGFSASHDDQHTPGELSAAAAVYATWFIPTLGDQVREMAWPWSAKWWKPKDVRRDLIRAAAQRRQPHTPGDEGGMASGVPVDGEPAGVYLAPTSQRGSGQRRPIDRRRRFPPHLRPVQRYPVRPMARRGLLRHGTVRRGAARHGMDCAYMIRSLIPKEPENG